MWKYNETAEYVRCSEDLKISADVKTQIKSWAISTNRTSTKRSKPVFRSPNNVFEVWITRLPDPDRNKGASGEFRLWYFFDLKENSIYLDHIEHREDLGFGDGHPRDKQRLDAYLEDLKNYLLKKLDPPKSGN